MECKDKVGRDIAVRAAIYTPLWNAFTAFTPVIPKEYWDVYSAEQRIKTICETIDKIIAYANTLGISINKNTDQINAILEEFDKFKEGAFDDYYQQVIERWVEENMPEIIEQAIKMVFFGLSDDGYFVAYIPDSWSDIQFDTGYNYNDPDTYMHLLLKY